MTAHAEPAHETALLALIKTVDTNSQQRHDALMAEMRAMKETHADLRQLGANISHIFGAEGTFAEMQKDIKRHNRYETVIKAVTGIAGMVGLGTLLQWGRSIFHLKADNLK